MENELKSDALNIGSKGQHDLRKTIIRMLKDGKKGNEIAKDLGVSVGHVSNVKKLYETGGAAALKPKKRRSLWTRRRSSCASRSACGRGTISGS